MPQSSPSKALAEMLIQEAPRLGGVLERGLFSPEQATIVNTMLKKAYTDGIARGMNLVLDDVEAML